MSDLLSRLVARATGEAKSPVEPILASRYETPARIPDLAAPFETFTLETAHRVERAGRAKIALDQTHKSEILQGSAEEIDGTHLPEAHDLKRAEMAGERQFTQKPQALVTKLLPHERKLAIQTREQENGDAKIVEATVIRNNSETPLAHDNSARAQSIESEQPFTAREHVVVSSASRNDRSAKHVLGKEKSITSSPSPAEVNVTIGTIEVRLSPPPPAPTRRAAPPKVSLDDYLARRSGSRR